jgi:alpha-tubulin suppressor-like RCC1 family protein
MLLAGLAWAGPAAAAEADPTQAEVNQNLPSQSGSAPGVTAVSIGDGSSCALLGNGTVQCWGVNWGGALGDGTTTDSATPVAVVGLSGVEAISVGAGFSCALLTAGTVRCWGSNQSYVIGDSTVISSSTPVPVAGLSEVAAISAGQMHICALLKNGTVRCWGYNGQGELGDGTSTSSWTPVPVAGLADVVAIDAGQLHTCALLNDGTLRCWGYNGLGELGDGTTTDSSVPVPVAGLSGVSSVSAGGFTTCAVLDDSTVKCWGYGASDAPPPVAGSGLSGVRVIDTELDHTCAVLNDGSLWCWGNNNSGQLGDGTMTGSGVPLAVAVVPAARTVAVGLSRSCAVLVDGTVDCWGWRVGDDLCDWDTTCRDLSPVPVVFDYQTPAGWTPTGDQVAVTAESGGGSGALVLTFDHVTTGGTTWVSTSASGPAPGSFSVGTTASFYDITTTATHSGSISVCLKYDPSNYSDPSNLRLYHHEGGAWVDVTTSLDAATDTICGMTTSLSPFVVGQKLVLAVTAPSLRRTYGADNPILSAAYSGFVDGDTAATLSTQPTCTTTATASSPVGTYPITCSGGVSTKYNFNYVAGTLSIVYRFDGFLQPINDTGHSQTCGSPCPVSIFKAGSTVPVKFQLKDANGNVIQSASLPIWATPLQGGPTSAAIDEATYTDPATSGSSFRWDGSQYVYNWSTKGLKAGYYYRITVILDDGTTESVSIGLR